MSHPVLDAVAAIDVTVTSVADSNPTFMSTDDKAEALVGPSRLESQVAELRLRVLADAGDVAAQHGAHDAARVGHGSRPVAVTTSRGPTCG